MGRAIYVKRVLLTASLFATHLAFSGLFQNRFTPTAIAAQSGSARVAPAAPHAKRALLIGAWDYDRQRGSDLDWWNLSSDRDVQVIQTELQTHYGFAAANIKPLTKREDTTHQAIIAALKQLIQDTQEGDIVYFQFSGHGQQIPDPSVIGHSTESLIPTDYVSRKDSSNNIKNSELRDLVLQLKDKKPANVTLVFDSCYSGNLTRGGRHLVRGSSWTGSPIVAPVNNGFGVPPALAAQGAPLRKKDATGVLYEGEAKSFGYVVIAASRYDQVAQETDDDLGSAPGENTATPQPQIGLLTYALAKGLAEARPPAPPPGQAPSDSRSTYRDLFERVTDLMSQREQNQTPAIAGDEDKVILGGTALPAEPFHLVSNDQGHLVLNGGSLEGVTSGSVFALYPPDTKHPEQSQPRAMAKVSSVQLAISKLELTGPNISFTLLDRNRAFEQEHVFGDSGLLVNLNDQGLPAEVSAKLRKLSVIRQLVGPNDPWEVRIRPRASVDDQPTPLAPQLRWIVEREDGSLMAALPEDDQLYPAVRQALEAEARWRAVKNLTNTDQQSPIQVSLKLIPVQVTKNPSGTVIQADDLALESNAQGQIALRDKGYVQFAVRNTGSKPAWVNVLDLANSGKIHPIFPVACENRAIVANGTWTRLPLCAIAQVSNPSERVEIFKLIATTDPVDLSGLADPDVAKGLPLTKGRFSPLEELLRAATLGQKSPGNEAVNPAYWSTDSVSFVVVPQQ